MLRLLIHLVSAAFRHAPPWWGLTLVAVRSSLHGSIDIASTENRRIRVARDSKNVWFWLLSVKPLLVLQSRFGWKVS